VLVDPQGASMECAPQFQRRGECFGSLVAEFGTERLRNFLATRGLVPSEKIKLDERIIPQGFPLFVFGTLGENKTMNASIPRPQNLRRFATVLQLSSRRRHAHVSDEFEARTECRQSTRVRKCAWPRSGSSRGNARPRMGTPVDAFSQGTQASIRAHRVCLPQQFFRSSRQLRRRLPALHQNPTKSVEFDLHPSVCIGKRGAQRAIHDFRAEPAEVAGKLAWQSAACIWGGPVLALISYYFLKILFRVASVSISALIVLFAVSGAIFYLVTIYNGLVTMRNDIDKSWANIDVLLKQRHDELPRLVDVCKGYMQYERETLQSLVEARIRYGAATTVEQKTQASSNLSASVGKLFVVAENYPALQANTSFLEFAEEDDGT